MYYYLKFQIPYFYYDVYEAELVLRVGGIVHVLQAVPRADAAVGVPRRRVEPEHQVLAEIVAIDRGEDRHWRALRPAPDIYGY